MNGQDGPYLQPSVVLKYLQRADAGKPGNAAAATCRKQLAYIRGCEQPMHSVEPSVDLCHGGDMMFRETCLIMVERA